MRRKAGFTLVELMVVAIIITILAAITIPVMLGNRQRAMATEGQTGLGVIRTAMELYKVDAGHYPESESGKNMSQVTLLNIKAGDLDGKYFRTDGYQLTSVTPSNFVLTATGYTNDVAGRTITLDERGNWGGTIL